ncbi:hypothetical protein JHK82_050274 [Glycine max]|nr:hypothetical protein JHK82_050274 [Glycine max]KAG5094587.1 hypothetical protein JHK84_050175 [Glycine max]
MNNIMTKIQSSINYSKNFAKGQTPLDSTQSVSLFLVLKGLSGSPNLISKDRHNLISPFHKTLLDQIGWLHVLKELTQLIYRQRSSQPRDLKLRVAFGVAQKWRLCFEYHKLKKLVEMKGTYYIDLVKFFYTTAHIHGDIGFLCAEVKGQQIVMTPEVWFDIVGLLLEGVMANQLGLKKAGFAFNKVDKYKSMRKNPSTYVVVVTKSKGKERFGNGPLMLEHRLLAYVTTQTITPRGSNHA